MNFCKNCKGYTLGWCVWKARKAGTLDRACNWYRETLVAPLKEVKLIKRKNKRKDNTK